MKMKEVTEKTELTERAVRLYIENGLVAPSVNESYSGRRNIDFSDEDVAKLRSISVLRKAGFSIAQIKLMQQEPEKSKEVLREFLDKTTGEIKAYSEIVACLTPLLAYEELSPEQISQSLERPVVEEKALPPEDSEPSAVQKLIRKLFFGVGVAGSVFAVLLAIPIVRVEAQYIKAYLYPHYSADSALALLWFFGAVLFPIPLIILNRKKSSRNKEEGENQNSYFCFARCTLFLLYLFYLCNVISCRDSQP